MLVNIGLDLFEGFANVGFQVIEQRGAEGITQQSIVEMFDCAPSGAVAATALGKKYVDVRIPFEVAPEGMENADEAGSEVFGLVHFVEHIENHVANRVKETVQQIAVLAKKGRSSSGMVNTQWRWVQRTSFRDMAEERRME